MSFFTQVLRSRTWKKLLKHAHHINCYYYGQLAYQGNVLSEEQTRKLLVDGDLTVLGMAAVVIMVEKGLTPALTTSRPGWWVLVVCDKLGKPMYVYEPVFTPPLVDPKDSFIITANAPEGVSW